jgi:hypothetical protein
MVYVLDPSQRVYTYHGKSRVVAICEAVRKYEPLCPVVRASVAREVWVRMTKQGYTLAQRPLTHASRASFIESGLQGHPIAGGALQNSLK